MDAQLVSGVGVEVIDFFTPSEATRLFVTNVHPASTEDDMMAAFSEFGLLFNVAMLDNSGGSPSKPGAAIMSSTRSVRAIVSFYTQSDAKRARLMLNGMMFHGRELRVLASNSQLDRVPLLPSKLANYLFGFNAWRTEVVHCSPIRLARGGAGHIAVCEVLLRLKLWTGLEVQGVGVCECDRPTKADAAQSSRRLASGSALQDAFSKVVAVAFPTLASVSPLAIPPLQRRARVLVYAVEPRAQAPPAPPPPPPDPEREVTDEGAVPDTADATTPVTHAHGGHIVPCPARLSGRVLGTGSAAEAAALRRLTGAAFSALPGAGGGAGGGFSTALYSARQPAAPR